MRQVYNNSLSWDCQHIGILVPPSLGYPDTQSESASQSFSAGQRASGPMITSQWHTCILPKIKSLCSSRASGLTFDLNYWHSELFSRVYWFMQPLHVCTYTWVHTIKPEEMPSTVLLCTSTRSNANTNWKTSISSFIEHDGTEPSLIQIPLEFN